MRRFGKDLRLLAWRLIAAAAVVSAVLASPQADAKSRSGRSQAATASPQSTTPLILVVSLRKQKVRAYDADGEIASSRVSSGRAGFATPTGVFSILQKVVDHSSNIYSGAAMPFMQRLTWSGIALHAGVVPGFRASHGCIRLPYQFSRTLYGITKVGTRVVVSNEETAPVAFSSPKLFNPLPADDAGAMNLAAAAPNPRLASNDAGITSTSDALQELPFLIGITPALARAVADMPRDPHRRPATRLEADQMMREKAARVRSDLKIADMAQSAASEKAKTAEKDFAAANGDLVKAERTSAPSKLSLESIEARQRDAILAFQSFMANGGDGANVEDREAQLENDVLERTREADAARNAAAKSEMDLAELKARAFMLRATRDAASEALRQAETDLISAQADIAESDKEMRLNSKPISVFVSLKAQRLYIRQGVEPVLEAPITVAPDTGTLGTHVFTAMRYGADPNTFDWRLVTAQTPSAARRGRQTGAPQPTSNVEFATAALNAFDVPEDVLSMISERARPGASLIVSDRELPESENGNGTEFVILTK